MSRSLGYTKKFIVFKKDFSNMTGLSPKGHGKIEIKGLKGNLSISLENAEEDQFYSVILVDRNNAYELGKVYTEKSGKGREDLTFNIPDLEASGFSVDKINGIIIKREKNILLGGYLDKEDNSIEAFISSLMKAKEYKEEEKVEKKAYEVEVEEIAEIVEAVEEAEIVEEVEEVEIEGVGVEEAEDKEEIKEEITEEVEEMEVEEVIEDVDEIQEDVFEPLENIETNIEIEQVIETEAGEDFVAEFEPVMEINQEPEPVAIESEETLVETEAEEMVGEPESEPVAQERGPEFEPIEPIEYKESKEEVVEIKNMDYEQNRRIIQRNQTTSYILNILRYFPHVDPFRINLNGYSWWRIDYQDEEKGFLPYFTYVVGGEKNYVKSYNIATSRDLMSSYGHYLFGIYNSCDEVKYYVYGVPGGFYKDEQPQGGTTGFNTWFPGNEISGYWLLYIDALTGKVIYPINPMIPTE